MRALLIACVLGAAGLASAHGFEILRLDVYADGRAAFAGPTQAVARVDDGVLIIEGLEPPSDVMVRYFDGVGVTQTRLLRAGETRWRLPDEAPAVFLGYLRLGTEHILLGPDHLLFVIGFVLLLGLGRPLLYTITAFTVGHSLTLAPAALGWLRVATAPVEVVIALSILLLAVELARPEGAPTTLTKRRPWLVAGGFGLLHGLGFAGALAEVGLPQSGVPTALFAFNVGVELGQLVVVAFLLAVLQVTGSPKRVAAYGMGTLAVAWTLQRCAEMGGWMT